MVSRAAYGGPPSLGSSHLEINLRGFRSRDNELSFLGMGGWREEGDTALPQRRWSAHKSDKRQVQERKVHYMIETAADKSANNLGFSNRPAGRSAVRGRNPRAGNCLPSYSHLTYVGWLWSVTTDLCHRRICSGRLADHQNRPLTG